MNLLCRCWIGMIALMVSIAAGADTTSSLPAVRPPAVPLIVHDPYFSIWSATDKLNESWPSHWTGAPQGMAGLVRVDGKAYRFMGPKPDGVAAMEQTSVQVLPTRTIYDFVANGLGLTVTFTTPVLPDDIDLMSRPVTYVSFSARSLDGAEHEVAVYMDACGELVTSEDNLSVSWTRAKGEGLSLLRMGRDDQQMLQRAGDRVRIDWGYLYLGTPDNEKSDDVVGDERVVRGEFVASGTLPKDDDMQMPRRVNERWPVLATMVNLGKVSSTPASAHVLVGYDDVYSIEYLGRRLRPYWRRNGMQGPQLMADAERSYEKTVERCEQFDKELIADLKRVGGDNLAIIGSLAYREGLGGGKIAADFDGTPLLFSKENSSNGCISTVDVFYPAAPFFLLFNPTLMKAQTTPILVYSASSRWKWPYAPHDLGTYPLANGQVYGGGERTEENQMPVEESGNMLILLAAITQLDGNAEYVKPYWPVITRWAEYLKEKGLDPENQLCTDDFAGHLAHNANLSVKAILGIASYAAMSEKLGERRKAEEYRALAGTMAQEWVRKADDGDHYRLTFDKSGTWSQKYNLVWDKVLGFNVFPAEIARKEIAYYLTKQNQYGLPLDSRATYTKLDWLLWTASLAEKREDFDALVSPVVKFINESPTRWPLTDWYETKDGKARVFTARPVMGGVFMPMLKGDVWTKWLKRAGGK